jgi:hypothetical protein
MPYALAYLGTLAFVGYWLWLNRRPDPKVEERLTHLRRTLDELGKAHLATAETVSTLALKSGLEPKKRAA